MNHPAICAALMTLIVTVCGCGRSDLPELGPVSGVVKLDGAPLANAIVSFTPQGEGRPSSAETDASGAYSLMYLPEVPGAIVGTHTVKIERLVSEEMDSLPSPDDIAEGIELQKGQELPASLPAAATDGSLTKEVKSGDNQINIELRSTASGE